MNTIHIIGRLTKKPELIANDTTKYVKFTLASQQNSDNTNFLPCIAFGKTAEFLDKYVNKGERIYATGYVKSVRKDDSSFLLINISKIEFADRKSENTEGFISGEDINYDDLPFDMG